MHRKTSIEAYKTIEAQGLLSRRRFQVYRCLFKHGPLTRNQLSEILAVRYGTRINPNLVSSRLIELRDRGVVEEQGERICTLTGMTVIQWDVTDRLPVEPPKEPKEEMVKCPHCQGKGKVRISDVAKEVHYKGDAHLQMDMFGGRL